MIHRRGFLHFLGAASPLAQAGGAAAAVPDTPRYTVVAPVKGIARPGFPGMVASVKAERSIDPATEKPDAAVVRQMMDRGMALLTGESNPRDAWRRFIDPADVVGIKVNCSGAPNVCSSPEVVAEIIHNLVQTGVKPQNIYVYERFDDQLQSVGYGKFTAHKVNILALEPTRGCLKHYDPLTYVETNFFGEEDTRSFLIRLVREKFTKIINVPNMKDHGAAGVTGCLKNLGYGNFSNVARSHAYEKTNTKTFIGTLCAVEPLRSKAVLHIMDGLKGVWHGGPFSANPRFRFFPKQMMFGTDPVAMDRLLLDIIDGKRKAEGARSVWDRSRDQLITGGRGNPDDPNKNRFLREPGHIEYAASLGLGVYDKAKIRVKEAEV